VIHIIITRRSDNHVKLLQMVWLQVIKKEIMQNLNCRIIAFIAILHNYVVPYLLVSIFVCFCVVLYFVLCEQISSFSHLCVEHKY